jgi:hypothetical protein
MVSRPRTRALRCGIHWTISLQRISAFFRPQPMHTAQQRNTVRMKVGGIMTARQPIIHHGDQYRRTGWAAFCGQRSQPRTSRARQRRKRSVMGLGVIDGAPPLDRSNQSHLHHNHPVPPHPPRCKSDRLWLSWASGSIRRCGRVVLSWFGWLVVYLVIELSVLRFLLNACKNPSCV